MGSKLFQLRTSHVLKYLAPIFLIYCFVVLVPLVISFIYSLRNDAGSAYVGLNNYALLVKDKDFWLSFRNNLVVVLICVIGQVGIAFLIASVLGSRWLKWRSVHRVAIFLPVVLAPVVTGYLWTLIYNYQFGLLNKFLGFFGVEPMLWLDDPQKVLYAVSVPLVWQYIGLYMIIFLAGMQNIPAEIHDAAEIDGASGYRKMVNVTLPLMKSVVMVALMLCISGTMKTFDHIYVMTGGGPGKSSMLMAQYAYNNAFLMSRIGYASTISIGMMVLSVAVVGLLSVLFRGGRTS
ncbi:sugar ABC transporter permease [Paenibacillaceae bacterium]|nr:sugar ABC transporter permease [Paenibacillaceae bacterium]